MEASKGRKSETSSRNSSDAALMFGIGARYVNATLAKWHSNAVHAKAVSEWIKNPKCMLVMIGNPKTGKTYFCVAVANYFLEKKRQVRYYNSRRIFEEIQKGIANNENQYETVSNMCQSDILILDDIGASTNSEWQKEIILDLIDRRYSEQKVTLVTSNLTEQKFKEALGERTSRRIFSDDNLILNLGNDYVR